MPSWGRKIVGRGLILIGVAFAHLGDGLCRCGAYMADINWEDKDDE